MISRRGLVRLLGSAAAGLGAAAAIPARARATARATLTDLGDVPATASPVHIPGQGWFETVSEEGEPDGIIRIRGANGQHWLRTEATDFLRPSWFAVASDGDDDAPAIQRACDHAARFGPFAIDLGKRRYRCRSPLTVDPTRAALRGIGAVLDFSAMPEPPQAEPVLTSGQIEPIDGWQQNNGIISRGEDASGPLTHYLPLPGEGRYRISLTVGAVVGAADFPVLNVAMTGANREVLGAIAVIAPGTYAFEIEGPQPAARLTLDSTADIRIDRLHIDFHGRRECLLIRSGEESPQYGHKWMEGIEIVGPGAGTRLHGLRFETNAEARSSRLTMRDLAVRDFHTGLVFSHRSYLIRATGLRVACNIGLHFLGGSQDAGELISLYGSVIDGGAIAILNNDAEVALFGTAIDFVDQVFVGSGRLMLRGCHLEVNRPKAADLPLIDIGQGNVGIDGGSFSVTGTDFEAGNQCDHIFQLRSRAATASMREVTTYNLRTQSGALAGGPGRLDTALMRGRRPRHMAPIVQFAAARNLLGALPLDLRTSESETGPFERFPTDVTTFKVTKMFRHIWLVGRAKPDAEVGVAFRIRSATPGTILAAIQVLDGQTRQTIGDAWPIEVGPDWATFRNNTADTHPASPMDGRMPEGFGEVALALDLTALEGTVELADFFLCAV